MAALVSLTLLPAILAALGPRVNALSPKRWQASLHRDASGERGGFWYRLSHAIMRRPVPFAVGATTLLIALGLPFLGIKFTGVDASVLPARPLCARGRRRAPDRVPAQPHDAGLRRRARR